MNSRQRGRLFCTGLASGFYVGCLSYVSQRGEIPTRTSLVLLVGLCAAAAYAIYKLVGAWQGERRERWLLRRGATAAWVVVAFIALSLWPACVTPFTSPLGTWCAVSSLVGAVTAWNDHGLVQRAR